MAVRVLRFSREAKVVSLPGKRWVTFFVYAVALAMLNAAPLPEGFRRIEFERPALTYFAVPAAINDAGEMAGDGMVNPEPAPLDAPGGNAYGVAYVLDHGKMTLLTTPPGGGAAPAVFALNNRRQALMVRAHDSDSRYFLTDLSSGKSSRIGMMASVDEHGVSRSVRFGYLAGLNDRGEVYGVYHSPRGFCVAVGIPTLGEASDLGPPPTAPAPFTLVGCLGPGPMRISAINRRGEITGLIEGHVGFIWRNGVMTKFAVPGAAHTEPTAINDDGVVAGFFQPYNAIDDAGRVANHFLVGGGTRPQKGFVYDGREFRLVRVPGAEQVSFHSAVLTAHHEVIGYGMQGDRVTDPNHGAGVGDGNTCQTNIHQAFVASIDRLPVIHMDPTAAENTAAAIARWRATPHPPVDPAENPFDRAFEILQRGTAQPTALSLRAVQLLLTEGPMEKKEMEVAYHYDDDQAYPKPENNGNIPTQLTWAQGSVDILWGVQLSEAQQTPEGAAVVVEAMAALIGEAKLDDLAAAGDLTDEMLPTEAGTPQAKARQAAKLRLLADMHAVLMAHPASAWPPDLSPATLQRWQPAQARPDQLQTLARLLQFLHSDLGANARAAFFSSEILHIEMGGTKLNEHTHVHSAWNTAVQKTDLLAELQLVSELVEKRTQGNEAGAEAVLRSLADVPAPGNCPGLTQLNGSGKFGQDIARSINPWETRHRLTGTLGNLWWNRIKGLRVGEK